MGLNLDFVILSWLYDYWCSKYTNVKNL